MPMDKPLSCKTTTCSRRKGLSAFQPIVALTTLLFVGLAEAPAVEAKSPGSRYCFHGRCYRVGTLPQTDSLVGWRGHVLASFYDSCRRDPLNPCGLTSSGAVFRPDLPDNAASPLLPDGTVILAYNPKTGDASVLRVTNAGPYSGERKLDVSRAAAEKLGFSRDGVTSLVITVLQSPTAEEAKYVHRRVYAKVPGYLGKFETVDLALTAASDRFDVRTASLRQDADDIEASDTASEENLLVPKPRLAVSPSLARELVMLSSPPRLASRNLRLVQGPRRMTREDFMAQQTRSEQRASASAPTRGEAQTSQSQPAD